MKRTAEQTISNFGAESIKITLGEEVAHFGGILGVGFTAAEHRVSVRKMSWIEGSGVSGFNDMFGRVEPAFTEAAEKFRSEDFGVRAKGKAAADGIEEFHWIQSTCGKLEDSM
jgi:hypothetical protein